MFAAVVCAAGAARPSLWFDEAATISASTRSVPELWRLIHNIDAVHGVYYLAMHGWFAIFPATEFWSRLSSCLAVGIAAAGVVVVGKQFSTRTVAVCAGIVFAILPRITWAGIEARSYALTAAAAVWLTVLVVAAARRNAAALWPLYGLALVVSTLLNVFVVLMVLVHAVVVPVVAKNRATVVWWAATSTVALVVVAPFLAFCRTQIAQVRWISPVHPGTVVDIAQEQYFDHSVPFALLAGVVLAAPLVVRRPWETRNRQLAVIALAWIALPTAVLLLYSVCAATDLLPSLPLLHLARDGPAAGGLHRGAVPNPRTRHGGAGRVRARGHPELPVGPARPVCQGRHGLQPGRRRHHRACVPRRLPDPGQHDDVEARPDPAVDRGPARGYEKLVDPGRGLRAPQRNRLWDAHLGIWGVADRVRHCTVLWTVSERDAAVPERESGPGLDPGPRLKRAPAYQVPHRMGFHIVERWQFSFAQVVKSTR